MARRRLVVPFSVLITVVVLSACGSSGPSPEQRAADACTAHTEACRQTKLVARQTKEYEEAGASHREAVCLAKAMALTKPIRNGTYVLLPHGPTSRAIDRCHIRPESLDKIGEWVRTHFEL